MCLFTVFFKTNRMFKLTSGILDFHVAFQLHYDFSVTLCHEKHNNSHSKNISNKRL